MQKLRIKFWRIENAVLMKVLEQPDCIERGCGVVFKSSAGIEFKSAIHPALEGYTIYLQGKDERLDGRVCCISSDTEADARERLSLYIQAVQEYNATLTDTPAEENPEVECIIAE